MSHHILISTDGSELATKGLDHGLSLARDLGAKVTIVTVTEFLPTRIRGEGVWVATPEVLESYEASQRELAGEVLDVAKAAAAKLGIEAETVHVPDSRPAEAIIETAKSQGCTMIVMSSHGRRGIGRLLMGSQAQEVLSHSPVPVLVVR